MASSNQSKYLRKELEDRLGAELDYADRDYNRCGWKIYARNGKTLTLDVGYFYMLVGNISIDYERYQFSSNHPMYSGIDIGTISYTTGTQLNPYYYYSNMGYQVPNDFQNNYYVLQTTHTPVKIDEKAKKRATNLKKLYWNMYSRLGKDPLKCL